MMTADLLLEFHFFVSGSTNSVNYVIGLGLVVCQPRVFATINEYYNDPVVLYTFTKKC